MSNTIRIQVLIPHYLLHKWKENKQVNNTSERIRKLIEMDAEIDESDQDIEQLQRCLEAEENGLNEQSCKVAALKASIAEIQEKKKRRYDKERQADLKSLQEEAALLKEYNARKSMGVFDDEKQ